MAGDAHPDGLRCPSCRSTNVVCHGRPHGHECQACGYDGTIPDPLAQAIALLRSHAEVCSRYGESDRLRAEADRIESLAGVAAGPQTTPPLPTGDRPRTLVLGIHFPDLDPETDADTLADVVAGIVNAERERNGADPVSVDLFPEPHFRVVAAPTSQEPDHG